MANRGGRSQRAVPALFHGALASPLRRSVTSGLLLRPLNIALSLAWIPIAIQTIGLARYGVWLAISSAFAWASLARGGMSDGMRTPLAGLYSSRDTQAAQDLIAQAVRALTLSGLGVATAASIVWLSLDLRRLLSIPDAIPDGELAAIFVVCIAVTAVLMPLGLAGVVFEAQNREYTVQIVSTLASATSLIVLVALRATRADLTLVEFAAIALAPPLATNSVLVVLASREKVLRLNRTFWVSAFHSRRSLELLRSAPAFLAFAVLAQVTYNTDSLVIAHYLGPVSVVPYATGFSAAMSSAALVFVLVHPFWAGFARAHSREDYQWIRMRFRQVLLLSIAGSLAIGVFLAAAGPLVFHYWVGTAATPSRWLFALFGAYLMVQASSLSFFMLLAGTGGVMGLGRFAAAEVVVNLGLSVWLVPRLGISGAALATLLASIVATGVALPWRGIQTLHSWPRTRTSVVEGR